MSKDIEGSETIKFQDSSKNLLMFYNLKHQEIFVYRHEIISESILNLYVIQMVS